MAKSALTRRSFLKALGLAGSASLADKACLAGDASAEESTSKKPLGLLIDTTRCAGCRSCEEACAEAHGLPLPDLDDESVFNAERRPTDHSLSVVNRFETDNGEVFVKRQCMHCLQPACATACLTKAMAKTPEGPVVWRESKCMGCRFCMISCPFDVPKFEYHSAVPSILKCDFCLERREQGEVTACVEACPSEALYFGEREEVLAEARRRIVEDPDDYVPEIYGENEVGGTGVLYLAAAPFDQLGFRTDLGAASYPSLTKEFLYGVPVILTVGPAFLLGLSNATKSKNEDEVYDESHESQGDDDHS